MLDSEIRNRPAGATRERGVKTLDRRSAKADSPSGRGTKPASQAHRWVAERRANRVERPTPRLPAFVAV